ncbi:hypothetical protein IQ277_21430 [Nostocales cyanobacterium LEGE 12452]|nr:hypothetical protein [Nostocales cyanobacterium LEGE 12452]
MEITTTQKQELQSLALYIKELPPDDLRIKITTEMLDSIVQFWELLGKALDAYFSDKENPIPSLEGVTEEFKEMMQGWVDHYLNLSVLLFKTEHLIRQEAEIQGFSVKNLKRSDLLKHLAFEHCLFNITLTKQKYWESLDKRQNQERSREVVKLFDGETIPEATKERWEQEDKKLLRSVDLSELLKFTNLCGQIFMQQHNLPEAKKWVSHGKNSKFSKFAVVNGVPTKIPGRGKDKQERKNSIS